MKKTRLMPKDLHVGPNIGPYSHGWRIDAPTALLYIGGQVADIDENSVAASENDIVAQTRQVFQNIGRVLRDGEADWGDVVFMTCHYMYDGPDSDLLHYVTQIEQVRGEFIDGPGPAWSAIRIPRLAYPGLMLEIDAVAAVGAR